MRRSLPETMLASLCVLAVASGCHTISRQVSSQWLPGQSYRASGCILILKVPDGVEHAEGPAGGSGEAFRSELRDQLSQHQMLGVPSEKAAPSEAGPDAAKYGCGYILKATITEWEENATEWSGKPDTFAVSADLYDSGGTLVATARHRVVGSDTLMLPRTPDRFYPEVADSILGRFFGWRQRIFTPR